MRNYTKGKPLSPGEKQFIVSLKHYFDRNKVDFGVSDLSVQMVADALEVGLSTVNRVMADFKKDPKTLLKKTAPRGRPGYAVENFHQEAVRSHIRSANLEGSPTSLELIRDLIYQRENSGSFHISTLARTLDRWGFEFGHGTRTQRFKEKDHVIVARARYLRTIRGNRKSETQEIRPEVYLDESYINKNHSNDFIWYSCDEDPLVQKPTGKGERLIIMNAITRDGWVPHAKVVFKSTKKTGDYHGQMNWELFKKWFVESLIPNIPDNSIIVMDNAPYHNVLSEHSPPTPQSSKATIKNWLEKNGFPFRDDCLKPELIRILEREAPEPIYEIDCIAAKYGHEVLRTPPYHPELQPIEICWGIVKNECARNCNFTMKGLQETLEQAFLKVTQKTCRKIIQKIREIEDRFWNEDAQLDTL
jgi:transposase